MALTFWISFAVVLYTYAGYPLCLAFLKKVAARPVRKSASEPTVSVVMAACNEEQNIARRIRNLLDQDYPPERVQIVVVSDGSEDNTAALAAEAVEGRGEVVALAERFGKAAALNAGMSRANGEIVVFCDARQSFERNAIRELVANFADASVGCVSGELILLSAETGAKVEIGSYWRYEKWIRRAESASGSVMGATGAIYAMRRALYRPLPKGTLLDDVMVPMRIVLQGYRVVFDGSAKAYDVASSRLSQEWVRKVRTLAGNWQLFSLLPALLIPWRNPFCWRYLSHKALRLLVPFLLVPLFLSGALLDGALYRAATALQLLFYSGAAVGGLFPATRANRAVSLSYFFLVMNAVAVAGFWRWATGRSVATWRRAYGEGD